MKRKERAAIELEAELVRLNALVRDRRQQLARLEDCPHKSCECRLVWRDHVEKLLASQVGKIRKQVRAKKVRASQANGRRLPAPRRALARA